MRESGIQITVTPRSIRLPSLLCLRKLEPFIARRRSLRPLRALERSPSFTFDSIAGSSVVFQAVEDASTKSRQ